LATKDNHLEFHGGRFGFDLPTKISYDFDFYQLDFWILLIQHNIYESLKNS
jgi:hypothetical protein